MFNKMLYILFIWEKSYTPIPKVLKIELPIHKKVLGIYITIYK